MAKHKQPGKDLAAATVPKSEPIEPPAIEPPEPPASAEVKAGAIPPEKLPGTPQPGPGQSIKGG